ncbi:alpha/beta fold hydrolase [Nocardioides terrae]|uniref:alpha/beta fold hydrolase n=1 Tax=Nocardioides terrae TaxID=574651 RepID=UPI0015878910|nr:alpha/beta hydrolase [Nocardioides terrae]
MIVTNGNAQLLAEERGTGTPVLLVHAGVTDRRSWRPLVERLGDGVRCVGYDARGYGETTYEAEDGWSPVADAVAVLDAHGIGRAVVVGASMGGRATIDLALARPDRVRGLVLIGSAVSGAPPVGELPSEIAALDTAGDAAYDAGDLDEVNAIEAHVWLDGPLEDEGRVGGATRELFLAMNRRALEAEDPGEQAVVPPAWDRLDRIGVPVLVLVGDLDLPHIRRNSGHLASVIPGARLVELPGVAHLPHLEGDPATLDAIAEFVASL